MKLKLKTKNDVLLEMPFVTIETADTTLIIFERPKVNGITELIIALPAEVMEEVLGLHLPLGNDKVWVLFQDIMYCETNRPYVSVVLNGKNAVNTDFTITELNMLLPEPMFFEIKNDCIVGKLFLKSIDKGVRGNARMTNGSYHLICRELKRLFKIWAKPKPTD